MTRTKAETKIIRDFLAFADKKGIALRKPGRDWIYNGEYEREVETQDLLYPAELDTLLEEFTTKNNC